MDTLKAYLSKSGDPALRKYARELDSLVTRTTNTYTVTTAPLERKEVCGFEWCGGAHICIRVFVLASGCSQISRVLQALQLENGPVRG